jgi:RimJ/RimL family protein N-acetyltransferase
MNHIGPARRPAATGLGTVTAPLRDGGTALLRPLGPGESAALLEVFEAMSLPARALRYFSGFPRMPAAMLAALSDVDGDRHLAWLATVDGAAAGIARVVRVPGSPTTAELAFEVVDAQHGRGLATLLVDAVTTAASARGIRSLEATVLPENGASRRLLDRLGLRGRVSDGLLELSGPLRLLDPSFVDRAAVLQATCGGWSGEALDIG